MNDEIKEIKIITLGDIFKNIETEDKAFMFLKYIKGLQNHLTNLQKENDDLKNRLENAVADCNLRLQENENNINRIHELEQEIDSEYIQKEDYKSKVEKAVEYYKMHQQECVIGRNRDDKLIKDYYLPAQHSKVLLNILQNGSEK